MDMNRQEILRFRTSDRDIVRSMWLQKDSTGVERPFIGDDVGFVRRLDEANRNIDGAGYEGSFQTSHLDFSHIDPRFATVRKNFRFLEAVVETTGNHNLNVDIFLDGIFSESVSFNLGVTGAALGTFVLGTDKLSSSAALNRKRRISGSGRRISLLGKNSGANEDFALSKMLVHFTLGADREQS